MSRHRAGTGAPVTRGMRVLLVVAAVLVFLAGFQLTVFATRTAEWFSWTIDVPMTAVFLGAAYWSSAVLEVAGARSRTWGRARLTVWTVLVFTVLTLVVTLASSRVASRSPSSGGLIAELIGGRPVPARAKPTRPAPARRRSSSCATGSCSITGRCTRR